MTVEKLKGGGVMITGDSINVLRLISVRQAIKLWLKCRMQTTRGATITQMLALATGATGNVYKKNDAGYQRAIDDLTTIIEG